MSTKRRFGLRATRFFKFACGLRMTLISHVALVTDERGGLLLEPEGLCQRFVELRQVARNA